MVAAIQKPGLVLSVSDAAIWMLLCTHPHTPLKFAALFDYNFDHIGPIAVARVDQHSHQLFVFPLEGRTLHMCTHRALTLRLTVIVDISNACMNSQLQWLFGQVNNFDQV